MADRLGIEPTLTLIALLPCSRAVCRAAPGGVPHEAAGHVDEGTAPSAGCDTMRPTYPGYLSHTSPRADHAGRPALIVLNVAGYLLPLVVPSLTFRWAGARRSSSTLVVLAARQLHVPARRLFHLLFNMLALWMFGVDLERQWGTRFFGRFYFVAGTGAALTTIVMSLLRSGSRMPSTPRSPWAHQGPSTACSSPSRCCTRTGRVSLPALPDPARVFVLIIGAISFLSSVTETSGGVALPRTWAASWPGTSTRGTARALLLHGPVAVAALAPRAHAPAVRRARGRPQGPGGPWVH